MKTNWKVLSISALLVLALAACGNVQPSSSTPSSSPQESQTSNPSSSDSSAGQSSASAPTEGIALYDAKSILIGTPKAHPENPNVTLPELKENMLTAPLATYHLGGKGDVPYVEVGQLTDALNTTLAVILRTGLSTELKSDGLHIYSADKKGEVILDASTDKVTLKNSGCFTHNVAIENNNVTGDYCMFRGNSIKDSEKTRVYKEDGSAVAESRTFDFAKYGFDIYQKDGKYYVPLEALSKVIYRDIGIDFAYNGKEFFLNSLGNYSRARIYSSKGYWQAAGAVFKPSEKKGEGEAYRFEYPYQVLKDGSATETQTCTKFMILRDDAAKTGQCIACIGTEYDPTKTIPCDESYFNYSWEKDGDLLVIRVSQEGVRTGDYVIHLDETNFNKQTIEKGVSEYNYNVLRFLFDNVYGLKAIKGYTDAEAYFESVGAKANLKSTEIGKYNEGLATLIGAVDDGHTSYQALSPYTAYEDTLSLNDMMAKHVGPRLKGLSAKQTAYSKARIETYQKLNPQDPMAGNTDPNYYQGLTFSKDKQTAVITFDSFQHSSAEIQSMGEMYPAGREIPEDSYHVVSRSSMISSSADGFSTAFQILKTINKTENVVKNVVVDLTVNGGGMIAVMPYLSAFFTDDPTYVLKDTLDNSIREYHYKVDLNADGVYGGEGDTFKGKFNFYFLTSGFSFSCGNCLPGMAKDAGAKIIGERSGGGASPVGVFLDALGSAINISNYTNMVYKGEDGKYVQNDAGIPLDHEFAYKDGNWYDPDAINAFINTIK